MLEQGMNKAAHAKPPPHFCLYRNLPVLFNGCGNSYSAYRVQVEAGAKQSGFIESNERFHFFAAKFYRSFFVHASPVTASQDSHGNKVF